jgi:hypothetical protein
MTYQNDAPIPSDNPRQPTQPPIPPGYGPQPSHPSHPVQQYPGVPGYGQQHPYAPQAYGNQQQNSGAWAEQSPSVSGLRVGGSITAIALGLFALITGMAGFAGYGGNIGMGFVYLSLIIAGPGTIAAAIVVLVKARSRRPAAVITLTALSGLVFLLAFVASTSSAVGFFGFFFGLLLATPVLILLGLALAREKARSLIHA